MKISAFQHRGNAAGKGRRKFGQRKRKVRSKASKEKKGKK